MMVFRPIACLFPLVMSALPAAADCHGQFDVPSDLTLSAYDPFSPVDEKGHGQLVIRNLGHDSCAFRVYFLRTPAIGWFGPAITYSVASPDGRDVLDTEIRPSNLGRFLTTAIAPGLTAATASYDVTVARGQISPSGLYADSVTAVLYRDDGTAELDRQTLHFTLPVASVSSVNLSGGGLSTAVDFGLLAPGNARSLILEARSNEPYQILFSSQHGGRLQLDPAIPGQDWSIGYRMDVDGAAADLASAFTVGRSAPATGEQSHTLSFQILDTGGKRAGLYKDVITARISTVH